MAHGWHHRRPLSGSDEGGRFSVTLVESPDIKIIGVGEGTWPTMRAGPLEDGRIGDRSSGSATRLSSKEASSPAGPRGRRMMLLSSADASAGIHPAQSRAALDGWNGKGSATSLLRRVDCATRAGSEGDHQPGIPGARQLFLSSGCRQVRALPRQALHREARRPPCPGGRHAGQPARVGDIESVLTPQAGEISGDLFIDCSGFCGAAHRKDTRCRLQRLRRHPLLRYRARRPGAVCHAGCAHGIADHLHRTGSGLDLGHLSTNATRGRLCVFEPPLERGSARETLRGTLDRNGTAGA